MDTHSLRMARAHLKHALTELHPGTDRDDVAAMILRLDQIVQATAPKLPLPTTANLEEWLKRHCNITVSK